MVSVPGSTYASLVRVRRGAPDGCGGHFSGLGRLFRRCPAVPAFSVRGRKRDLSGCLAVHPVPLPCSTTPAGPTSPHRSRTCRCCPRRSHTEGPSGDRISRLATWLQHLPPTLHELRCRSPCKAGFRLAGCAFAGRELNPLDRYGRFQITSILLPRPLPDAREQPAKE